MIKLSAICAKFPHHANFSVSTKMALKVALVFCLTLTPPMVSSSLAKSQGEVETFEFLAFGDTASECGKGVNINLKSCDIEISDDNITKKLVTDDNSTNIINITKLSDCNYKASFSSSDGVYELNFDFSRLSNFDYDKYISERTDKGAKKEVTNGILNGYYKVFGVLYGVKMSGVFNGYKREEDGYSIDVFIKASGLDSAIKRYEAAISYFRENFCSGSAF